MRPRRCARRSRWTRGTRRRVKRWPRCSSRRPPSKTPRASWPKACGSTRARRTSRWCSRGSSSNVAALLQRLGRHAEAIDEYQAVLKLAPVVGVWWIGLGLSQEAADHPKEAAQEFRRAKASGNLSADLMDFVERKLQAGAR